MISIIVLSCHASQLPLSVEHPWDQVAKLWDLFLSQGLHLSVLVSFALVSLVRGAILGGNMYFLLFLPWL